MDTFRLTILDNSYLHLSEIWSTRDSNSTYIFTSSMIQRTEKLSMLTTQTWRMRVANSISLPAVSEHFKLMKRLKSHGFQCANQDKFRSLCQWNRWKAWWARTTNLRSHKWSSWFQSKKPKKEFQDKRELPSLSHQKFSRLRRNKVCQNNASNSLMRPKKINWESSRKHSNISIKVLIIVEAAPKALNPFTTKKENPQWIQLKGQLRFKSHLQD